MNFMYVLSVFIDSWVRIQNIHFVYIKVDNLKYTVQHRFLYYMSRQKGSGKCYHVQKSYSIALCQRNIVTIVVYCIPGIEGFDLPKQKNYENILFTSFRRKKRRRTRDGHLCQKTSWLAVKGVLHKCLQLFCLSLEGLEMEEFYQLLSYLKLYSLTSYCSSLIQKYVSRLFSISFCPNKTLGFIFLQIKFNLLFST